jgi:hypothetical protein
MAIHSTKAAVKCMLYKGRWAWCGGIRDVLRRETATQHAVRGAAMPALLLAALAQSFGQPPTCPADFQLLNGTGLAGKGGSLIASVDSVASASACCALCASAKYTALGCEAWTWHDNSTATASERRECKLLKGHFDPHTSTGAFSGRCLSSASSRISSSS